MKNLQRSCFQRMLHRGCPLKMKLTTTRSGHPTPQRHQVRFIRSKPRERSVKALRVSRAREMSDHLCDVQAGDTLAWTLPSPSTTVTVSCPTLLRVLRPTLDAGRVIKRQRVRL